MLKWLIRNRLAAFERTFDYDMSYAREMLEIDSARSSRSRRCRAMGSYRKDVPIDVSLRGQDRRHDGRGLRARARSSS